MTRLVCVLAATLIGVGALAAAASAATPSSPCGRLVLHHRRQLDWSVYEIRAGGVGCAAARGFVDSWDRWFFSPQSPAWLSSGYVDRHHEIIYGRYGRRSVRFNGYRCRWAALAPRGTRLLAGRGLCTASRLRIEFTDRPTTKRPRSG